MTLQGAKQLTKARSEEGGPVGRALGARFAGLGLLPLKSEGH